MPRTKRARTNARSKRVKLTPVSVTKRTIGEVKQKSVIDLNALAANSAVIRIIPGVQQGDDIDNRDGRAIKVLDYTFRYSLHSLVENEGMGSCRVIWGRWKQPFDSTPLYYDILDPAFTGVGLMMAPYNPHNFGLFDILGDRLHTVGPSTAVTGATSDIINSGFDYAFVRRGKHNKVQTYYNTTNNTQANWSAFILFITDDSWNTSTLDFHWSYSFKYTDI